MSQPDAVGEVCTSGGGQEGPEPEGCEKNRALIKASRQGILAVVCCILQEAGDRENTDTKVKSLYIASARGHLNIVKELVTYGANVNQRIRGRMFPSPVLAAVHGGHIELVKWFICTCLVDVSDMDEALTNNPWFKSHTTASLAAYFGQLDITRWLISTGRSTTRSSLSPLFAAASNDQPDVVTYLLGIDTSVIDMVSPGVNLTPLGFAVLAKYDMCTLSLLSARANVGTIPPHLSLPTRIASSLAHWDHASFILHTNIVRSTIFNAIPQLHEDVV